MSKRELNLTSNQKREYLMERGWKEADHKKRAGIRGTYDPWTHERISHQGPLHQYFFEHPDHQAPDGSRVFSQAAAFDHQRLRDKGVPCVCIPDGARQDPLA